MKRGMVINSRQAKLRRPHLSLKAPPPLPWQWSLKHQVIVRYVHSSQGSPLKGPCLCQGHKGAAVGSDAGQRLISKRPGSAGRLCCAQAISYQAGNLLGAVLWHAATQSCHHVKHGQSSKHQHMCWRKAGTRFGSLSSALSLEAQMLPESSVHTHLLSFSCFLLIHEHAILVSKFENLQPLLC